MFQKEKRKGDFMSVITGQLEFAECTLHMEFDTNEIAKEFINYLPITSEAHNIGGEIYFRVPTADIPYESKVEQFEIGDVVYWRAADGSPKFAIAMFYGTTEFGDWKVTQASSPCVKIGHIIGDVASMGSVLSGETVVFTVANG